jgi:uncharacterized protein YjbI with pentapeptide repeats
VREEEHPVGRKKPGRKAEPPSKHGITWPRWTGLANKTVWDWLQLLIVPLVLAVLGFSFTAQQDARQQQIEIHRAKRERAFEEQRAQDVALQAYLDQMTQLILNEKLLDAEEEDSVYILAQARTSTIMTRLDAEHNRSVTRFLSDSGLTGAASDSTSVLRGINLEGADLSGAILLFADLSGSQLDNADLHNASLQFAILTDTDLIDADLTDADLHSTDLSGAYLKDANLAGADLTSAKLEDTTITQEQLQQAKLF